MRRWVDQAHLAQVIRGHKGGNINGGASSYLRQFLWALGEGGKGTWILNRGLVKQEDRRGGRRGWHGKGVEVYPLEMKVKKDKRKFSLKEWGIFMLLTRLQIEVG
jgi:hypothetical protein